MDNLWKHLTVILLFIIVLSLTMVGCMVILKVLDTEEWKRDRQKHRLYDPIKHKERDDDEELFIGTDS